MEEDCREVTGENNDLFVVFMYLEKAYDRIQRKELLSVGGIRKGEIWSKLSRGGMKVEECAKWWRWNSITESKC